MTSPLDKRCINHSCPLNKECALFVKASRPNELLFAGYVRGGECDSFEELHKPYGVGPEEND